MKKLKFCSFERYQCGCVGIRLSPAFSLFGHLCDGHAGQQEDRAVFNISACKEKGTRLAMTSREVDRIQRQIDLLLMDGRCWRRVRKAVADALMLEIPS